MFSTNWNKVVRQGDDGLERNKKPSKKQKNPFFSLSFELKKSFFISMGYGGQRRKGYTQDGCDTSRMASVEKRRWRERERVFIEAKQQGLVNTK